MTLFVLAAGAGIALGLARGGRFVNLHTLHLRYAWLVLPALAAQLVGIFLDPTLPGQGSDPLRIVLPLTFVPLTLFVWANRGVAGMPLVLLGLASNLVVIAANGGLMPTNESALLGAGKSTSVELAREHPGIRLPRSKDVVLPVEETRLWLLSDVLVSPPLPRRRVMSVGDLMIGAGLALAIAAAMRGRQARRRSLTRELAASVATVRLATLTRLTGTNRRATPELDVHAEGRMR